MPPRVGRAAGGKGRHRHDGAGYQLVGSKDFKNNYTKVTPAYMVPSLLSPETLHL